MLAVSYTHLDVYKRQAKYGTTTSIMDYARNNYVAQPEDKNVRLIPPLLGVYDILSLIHIFCGNAYTGSESE